jgi:hypothetical protein
VRALQGASVASAICQIGVTKVTFFHRRHGPFETRSSS